MMMAKAGMVREDDEEEEKSAKKNSVKIEAKFDVAEYKILILSAKDSTGLETWLKDNKYKIPTRPSRCCVRTWRAAVSSSSPRSTPRRSR